MGCDMALGRQSMEVNSKYRKASNATERGTKNQKDGTKQARNGLEVTQKRKILTTKSFESSSINTLRIHTMISC